MRLLIGVTTVLVVTASAAFADMPRRGEWIVRPDGSPVCRFSHDLTPADHASPLLWCDDWREPQPRPYTPLSSVPWARNNSGRIQFLVEGIWKP
jgi:hypothetical protein